MSAYADDVLATMDAIGVRSAIVVGHSLGGAVAAALADRAPRRVRSLVLLAPAGFGRIALAEAASIPGIRDVTRRVLPLALANPASVRLAYSAMISNHLPPDDELLERVTSHATALVPGAVAALEAIVAAGLSRHAFHRRRLSYAGPAVALWGTHDRLVPPAHEAGVARALPQAELLRWRGMGHHPQRERLDALIDLLDQVARPGARQGRAA
jgi:pimeloyl-ACP methyl ester carboxylesterase